MSRDVGIEVVVDDVGRMPEQALMDAVCSSLTVDA